MEELGVTFVPTFFEKLERQQTPDDPEKAYWDIYVYSGRMQGEVRVKTDENSEAAFVSRDTLDDFNIAFNHKEILQRFFDGPGSKRAI